ncbi:DUF192 domain-containing protein [Pannonibacter carbonis]|uniref:DUF192 domain-containing protein n=1 Tax=Pannonibacter carbonis TaxID=2067569 RepID=UPI000D0F906C|nr:DUF192 domain-containing protein [Pannonibacter carbonis]
MRITHFTAPSRALPVRGRPAPAASWREAAAILARAALIGVIVLFGVLATRAARADTVSAAGLPVETVAIATATGPVSFVAEVVSTEAQRAIGLMNRKELAADAGMLFVFEREGERHFWMQNTYVALDMIFIAADGKIVSIAPDTTPLSQKIISSGAPALYVLEVVAGTSARLGIEPGQSVTAPSILRR